MTQEFDKLLKAIKEMEVTQEMKDEFVARLNAHELEWEEEERKRRLGMSEFLNRRYTI